MKIVFNSTLITSLTPHCPWICIDLYCHKFKATNIPSANATVIGYSANSAKEFVPSIDFVLYINFILSFLLKLYNTLAYTKRLR